MAPNNHYLKILNRDPIMKKLIQKFGDLTLTGSDPSEYFNDLAKSIIGQQLSGKAADTITARVAALMGGSLDLKKILKLPIAVSPVCIYFTQRHKGGITSPCERIY